MARPTSHDIASFGPSTTPFGRNPQKSYDDHYKEAHWIKEDFENEIHDAVADRLPDYPNEVKRINKSNSEWLRDFIAEKERNKEFCYLWILDDGGIKILYEGTPNFRDEPDKEVKHTNITGGQEAYHGGEMFITENNEIFINDKSDRYGYPIGHPLRKEYWQAALRYFQNTYDKYKVVDLTELI
ncbi:MAG TPA: hypothetical protein VE978_17515 [Chitinophagales bacterium]|nr:hypothetical protein [Chitinophagales bacterium]